MNDSIKISRQISTSSIEDGLDFACSLISGLLAEEAERSTAKVKETLIILTQYIQLRYVGELGLALEYLGDLGKLITHSTPAIKNQFWPQLSWVASQMNISTALYDKGSEN